MSLSTATVEQLRELQELGREHSRAHDAVIELRAGGRRPHGGYVTAAEELGRIRREHELSIALISRYREVARDWFQSTSCALVRERVDAELQRRGER